MDKTVGEGPSGVDSWWKVEVMGVHGDISFSPE
jgi:hypothetical protein